MEDGWAVIKRRGDWAVTSRKIAFWAGLLGLGYETIWEEVDRPWLFLVFLTMMGLAQFGRVFDLLGKDDGVSITFGSKPKPPPTDSKQEAGT